MMSKWLNFIILRRQTHRSHESHIILYEEYHYKRDCCSKVGTRTTVYWQAHTNYVKQEYQVLFKFEGGARFPHSLWFGREGSYHVMVMDNLSPFLDELLKVFFNGAL